MAESWKSTKIADMTGEQLAVTVRQGVLQAWGVALLFSALVGVAFWVVRAMATI
jgi:hypothetical protein